MKRSGGVAVNVLPDCRQIVTEWGSLAIFIDLLIGLFGGAVFDHVGVPKNCPLVLMGRFPSLMGRFPTLMGRFPECLNGPFSLLLLGKQPIKKRGVKRFLIFARNACQMCIKHFVCVCFFFSLALRLLNRLNAIGAKSLHAQRLLLGS